MKARFILDLGLRIGIRAHCWNFLIVKVTQKKFLDQLFTIATEAPLNPERGKEAK